MKKKIQEVIYSEHFRGDNHLVRVSDLPKDIQDDDIIDIHREEDYYSENLSWKAYTKLEVIREREETDEEYQKRISKFEKEKEEMKERRYKTFLKLKEEFEPSVK